MKNTVSPERYNDSWIKSAWGGGSTTDLLTSPNFVPRPRVARAMQLADIQKGQRLLDIACGRGETPVLACKQGAFAVGLDFSPYVLKIANKLKAHMSLDSEGRAGLEFIQADATVLPFGEGMFDRVTMLDIIEHLAPNELERMFLEVHRVLKPGGYAIVHTLPNKWVYEITYPLFSNFSHKFPSDPRNPIEREIHINEQDLPSLHRTLKKTGFEHRLWLDQLMPAQARWQKDNDIYEDTRDTVYPILTGVAGRVLEFLSKTPLKLLLCNDIYGVLWKNRTKSPNIKMPAALTERISFLL